MTKAQDQRSHSIKEQAYNIIKTKDSRTQRQSNLNKSKEARFKISPQEFKDHTLGDIVSLKGKNKTGFIDGSCKRFNTDEVIGRQWDRVNVVVLSSIISIEVLPNFRSAYATISNEESHRVASGSIVGSSQRNQAYAFVSNVHNRGNFQRNQSSNNVPRPNNVNNNRQNEGSGMSSYWDISFYSKIGNLILPNGLVLFDVLVVLKYCVTLKSVHKLAEDNKIFVAFNESRCYFLNQDLNLKNVLGIELKHINFFDNEYPEMPNDDERVEPNLNSDYRSQSDSSHSSVPGGGMDTADFPSNNSGNDANSSDDIFAAQDEQTDAMNNEMDALFRNDTWNIVDLPKDRLAIISKWIFKIKYKSSGEIDRYKARLVAQGFGQTKEIDYEETFSPVVKMVTVRCLLNVDVSNSWHVFRLDVNNAFLYDDMVETSDNGVFLALLVYVDDIIITGNSISETNKFKVLLKSKFMIKDLGKLKYFLGIEDRPTPLTDYQKLMGKLIYLSYTRPDISYDVYCLSQFMHSPLKSHLNTAFKILRYLKSCPGLGIHIVKNSVKVDSANQIANIRTKGLDTLQHKVSVEKLVSQVQEVFRDCCIVGEVFLSIADSLFLGQGL
ncbi:ribonuclease H-like domain-containing protein [Tanacetum coccineum]